MGSAACLLRDPLPPATVLITMRNRSRRPFTVEVKSGGRDQRTIIPRRAAAPVASRPSVSWPQPAEPQERSAELRRILPSLIVPEASLDQPEPSPAAEERSAQPRRGRPRKAKPVVPGVAMEPLAKPAVEIAATTSAPVSLYPEPSPGRTTKPSPALRLGERWKRRLGRWAR